MTAPTNDDSRLAYDRALRDYTQLIRHRIANPLTAITAGLATLRDLDLDQDTRAELLEAMIEQAHRLERVALHPLVLREEENELRPMVELVRERRGTPTMGDDLRTAERHRRAGMNEAQFRTVNEHIIDVAGDDHPLIEIACECSDLDCADALRVTTAEYQAVHAHPARFMIAPHHEVPELEDVVDCRNAWWAVEKLGVAGDQATRLDADAELPLLVDSPAD